MEYVVKTKIYIEDKEFLNFKKEDVLAEISSKFFQVWDNDHEDILRSAYETLADRDIPEPDIDEDKANEQVLLHKYGET